MIQWAKRLKEALRQSGWTKTELSRRSGVNYDSLKKYLAGKVEQPRGDSLPRLARSLGVSGLWLREGVGPKAAGKSPGGIGAGKEPLTPLGGQAILTNAFAGRTLRR